MSIKKMMVVKIFFICLFLSACGSGSDTATTQQPAAHIPAISNLSYSPKTAVLNSGGGQIAVALSFNFYDLGGDINQVNMNV